MYHMTKNEDTLTFQVNLITAKQFHKSNVQMRQSKRLHSVSSALLLLSSPLWTPVVVQPGLSVNVPASEALTGTALYTIYSTTQQWPFFVLRAAGYVSRHICVLDADWGVPRVLALVASCMVCLSTHTSVLAALGYSLQWLCTLIRSTVCIPPIVHRCVCSVVLCVGPTYLLIMLSITNHGPCLLPFSSEAYNILWKNKRVQVRKITLSI